MRGVLTLAGRLKAGDVVLDGTARRVERTMGVQGRKPKNAAPLMRVSFKMEKFSPSVRMQRSG